MDQAYLLVLRLPQSYHSYDLKSESGAESWSVRISRGNEIRDPCKSHGFSVQSDSGFESSVAKALGHLHYSRGGMTVYSEAPCAQALHDAKRPLIGIRGKAPNGLHRWSRGLD